jgi:hypothetical protein
MRPNILMPIMIFMTRYYNRSRHTHRIVSVSYRLFCKFRMTLFVGLVIYASSCKKEVLTIGADLLPNGDFVSIKAIDTLSIFSYTGYTDSVRTDNPTYSYIGQLYDPYFGTTTAGFVSQIRLSTKWDGLPFTVDSMKLFLHFLSTMGGGTDATHTLTISEISDQIYNDTAYYSTTPINLTGFKVSDIALPSLRTDTINDIELNLPGKGVEFGEYLTRDTTKLFYNNNVPDLRSYFKGLYFQMNSNSDPLMVSLSLVYDQSTYYNYFVLFVHDDSGTSKQYSFILDAKNINASFNKYTHDYSTAILGDKIVHRNTNYRDTLSYMQSLNGVYTKVALPGLAKIKNDPSFGKVAINKARLVIPVHFTKTAANPFISKSLPPQLVLRYKAKSGIKYPVTDYLLASTTLDLTHAFFDGQLDTVAQVYNFNIPDFVQKYLNDNTGNVEPELEIYEGSRSPSQSVIVPAPTNAIFQVNKSKNPVKFEFTYTKF